MSAVMTIEIRPYADRNFEALWSLLRPMIEAGETYALPTDMGRDKAVAYWRGSGSEVWIAEIEDAVVGTYFLRANQRGGGAHVANCGYVVSPTAQGRGVAKAMCLHSLQVARNRSFRAMQFNFVVSTNERAVYLWKSLGFAVAGTLPRAFSHPLDGYVDVFVMFKELD